MDTEKKIKIDVNFEEDGINIHISLEGTPQNLAKKLADLVDLLKTAKTSD